ncbi:hypothetical protein S7711_04655 [Stachybotrys chartarum IBT 7711]|uniref:Protein kinase domain-containing protein n=1 Tax=Stachybotrys chartarum (strain CBS 109288 / IBT 7711) TaxID=1280523 RepID=A0A084B608_STACB|nr:hypothetical protein S7711_04655 [Stachybotrys chartarum IBT 7711]
MIDQDSRFFSLNGDIPVGGPSTWHITDWDQRRVISVIMDGEQDDEGLAIEHLGRHIDHITPSTYAIYVSPNGEIISKYSDAKHDQNYCVHYPFLHDVSVPDGIESIRRDKLEELERLGPDVDLVGYPPCAGTVAKKVVFKYYFLWHYAQRSWDEMNLWMRLPRHPNIVPFDRIVVDELQGRVVGFTNEYFPGGTLEERKGCIFQLKWLHQLVQVVDDLNLRFSIAHQDIDPRNLLLDESTDSVRLFDFNFAARINKSPMDGAQGYREARNDIKGVIFTVYEIITRDNSLRSVSHEEQRLWDLEKEWTKHPDVKLDHAVKDYQLALQEWQTRREAAPGAAALREAPEAIDWPQRPKPPPKVISAKDFQGNPTSFTVEGWYENRQDIWSRGGQVLNWERPPQSRVDKKTRLLVTGQAIDCSELT